tara:strand:- start:170 stop:616 length:447 start_codon:yes stop_codon:yes gene_type:complete
MLLHIHPTDVSVVGKFLLPEIKGLIQFNLNIPIVFVCKQLQKEVVSNYIILDKYSRCLLSIEGFRYLLDWQASMNSNSMSFIPKSIEISRPKVVKKQFKDTALKSKSNFDAKKKLFDKEERKSDRFSRITFTQDYEEPKKIWRVKDNK